MRHARRCDACPACAVAGLVTIAPALSDTTPRRAARAPRARRRRHRCGIGRVVPGQRPAAGGQRPDRAHQATTPAHRGIRAGDLRADTAHADGRHHVRGRPQPRPDRRHHELHQHVQPGGHDRRRPAGQEGGRAGTRGEAVGEDVGGPRFAGRDGLLRTGRTAAVPRGPGLRSGRVRVHHLHRQLRADRSRPLRRRRSSRRPGLGAVREPKLRRTHQSRRPHELPRLAAPRDRLRPGRHDGHRHLTAEPLGTDSDGNPVLLADGRRGATNDSRVAALGDVHRRLRVGVRRRRPLERPRRRVRPTVRMGRHLHLPRRSTTPPSATPPTTCP